MPPDCPVSFPNFSFVPGASWEFQGVSRRSVQSQLCSITYNRIQWIWILRYTSLDLFSFRVATSTSHWVSSHRQDVEIGNIGHKCICFQTCNHDTRDDDDNHTTIFFILPSMDKGFWALVAGLASRFELFTSVCSFTFRTEEDACSRRGFSCVLHFLPRYPHGLLWHACVENHKSLFLNSTQLSSAGNSLQSSARCQIYALFPFVTAPRSVISQIKFPIWPFSEKSVVLLSSLLFDADPLLEVRILIVAPFQSCRHHQIQFFTVREIFTRNCFWIDEVLQRAGCFEFLVPTAMWARDSSSLRKHLLGNFTIQHWNSVWSGNVCRCISEERWLGIAMPLWVQVPIPKAWLVI